MTAQRGFTLLELLVVLSILGIMMLIAISGYASWLNRVKSDELVFELQRSLSHARSLALKHGGRIHLCGSDDGATCTGSMNKGWIIFLDEDGSGQVESTENVTRVYQNTHGVFQISMENPIDSTSINGVSFNYKGYSETSIEAVVQGSSITRSFSVSRSGYVV